MLSNVLLQRFAKDIVYDIYAEYIDMGKQISQLQYFKSIISAIDNSQRSNHLIDPNREKFFIEDKTNTI